MTASAERLDALGRLGAPVCEKCKRLVGPLRRLAQVVALTHLHVETVNVCSACSNEILVANIELLVLRDKARRR